MVGAQDSVSAEVAEKLIGVLMEQETQVGCQQTTQLSLASVCSSHWRTYRGNVLRSAVLSDYLPNTRDGAVLCIANAAMGRPERARSSDVEVFEVVALSPVNALLLGFSVSSQDSSDRKQCLGKGAALMASKARKGFAVAAESLLRYLKGA